MITTTMMMVVVMMVIVVVVTVLLDENVMFTMISTTIFTIAIQDCKLQ